MIRRAICDRILSPSPGIKARLVDNKVIPINRDSAIIPITIMVKTAFRDSGGLKAFVPLLIASIPVKAVHPPEKARRSSQRYANPVGVTTGGIIIVSVACIGLRPNHPNCRINPKRTTTSTPTTNE